MKAKILLLALLLLATGLPAQTPVTNPPAAGTNRPALGRPNRTLPGFPGATPGGNPAAVTPAATPAVPGAPSEFGAMTLRPPASASTIPEADKIVPAMSINWPAASLENVLEIYCEYVGRILLRPGQLPKADIVLKQTTPLTKLEVVQMIEAAMYLNQVSVVNVGEKFVTVVPTADAAKIPGIMNTNSVHNMPDLGSIVTHVVQLKYNKPSEMAQVLQAFISGTAANPIMPLDGSGILVLRDNVANVKRMLEMIEKVDVVAESEILSEVIPIKFAKAEEIASALSSVGGGTAGTLGSRSSSSTRAAGGAGASRQGLGSNPGGYNPNNPTGGLPGAQTTPTPSSGQSFGDRVRNLISKASGSGDFSILGETKIIADIRSNSLLVFAAKRDMDMIKDIIAKLDVVLAQVLIETIIMDVSLDNSWAFGVSAAQTPKQMSGSFSGAGGMNLKRFTDVGNTGSSGTNAFSDLVGTGLRYFGVINDDVYVQLEAAASDNKINVIQKPRIQTSHATPASIFIGNTVPYVTSTYYGGGYAGGPSSSYQQLKVGIGLDVTPFINSDGLVVMQIQETIDEISGSTDITGVGAVPNTTSRTLSAEVAVNDKESIMLGGFIRNSGNKTKSGVPLLKDIPLLGALFRSTGDAKERKELMVLMRPTVLRTPSLAALQVEVEKKRLPGVVAAEKELDKTERALNKQEKETEKAEQEKEARKAKAKKAKETERDPNSPPPFTPEDELMLDNPPANPTP